MKKLIIIIITIFYTPILLKAQCIADAGTDKVVCVGWNNSAHVQLDGQLASGGVAPYTYSWSGSYSITVGNSTFTYHASDFLDDTSLANPTIHPLGGGPDSMNFVLKVTDANDQTCTDTVKVRFSNFVSSMSYQNHEILQGDSVYIGGTNIFGGIQPYSYLWLPNSSLSDSTSAYCWAKPSQTTYYSVWITDSAGCKAFDADYQRVFVGFANVAEFAEEVEYVNVYPSPTTDILTISSEWFGTDDKNIQIFDANGKMLTSYKMVGSLYSLDVRNFPEGLYFYKIKAAASKEKVGKFVVGAK